MGRSVTRWFATAAIVVVLLASGPAAEAGHEETEHRLKIAGVAPEMRQRIHEAIERGARYLLSVQSKDGAFRPRFKDHSAAGRSPSGPTVLCGLALAHSGGTEAWEGALRTTQYLFPEGRPLPPLVTDTYVGGLGAMLLAATGEHPEAARAIVRALVGGLANPGWWGYELRPGVQDLPNLSTSQFGALGMWAGARAGGLTSKAAWRRHLLALERMQSKSGSWPYDMRDPGHRGYETGTFMGHANVLLGRGALQDDLPDDPVFAARIERMRRRSRAALDSDGLTFVQRLPTVPVNTYSLYALEKACIFADVERLDGRSWYAAGAVELLKIQNADGSWPNGPVKFDNRIGRKDRPDLVTTAFALLFLLRSPETDRPQTPREIGAPEPSSPVTPGPGPSAQDESLDKEKPVLQAPPIEVPLTVATDTLDRLEKLLGERRVTSRAALARIEDVAAAFRLLAPDRPSVSLADEQAFMEAEQAWRGRAEALLMRALERFSADRSQARTQVAVRAAEVLRSARPETADDLRKLLAKILRRPASTAAHRGVLGPAFVAVAVHGGDDTLRWLVSLVGTGQTPARVRASRAALAAIAELGPADGRDRLRAMRTLARTLTPLERSAAKKADTTAAVAHGFHWRELGPPAVLALRRLATDPETGVVPALDTIAACNAWLADHGDPRKTPWSTDEGD